MDHPRTTPRDFFLWLSAIVASFVSVIALLALWFEIIDRTLGASDTLRYVDTYSGGMRAAIASLLVVFPIGVWFLRLLHRDGRIDAGRRDLPVRKWLLVATLFVAGVTLAIDLIVLVNTYLGGEVLTGAFLAKVASVFAVVGGSFLYYFHDLKGRWYEQEKQSLVAGGLALLLVVASLVSGVMILGSPQTQRLLREDEQRVSDLQSIQWQVVSFWQKKEVLPSSLDSLADPLSGFVIPTDPAGIAYEYRALSGSTKTDSRMPSFELCATFAHDARNASTTAGAAVPVSATNLSSDIYWNHGVGRTCFTRTIDPEQYPKTGVAPVGY